MPRCLCVYCGSRPGDDPRFADLARQTGQALVDHQLQLVYGGGSVGMMGVLADSVLENNGYVHGIIPTFLDRKEITHPRVQHMEVVDSMHARKARFVELADAFLALPGGFGTLEELFETVTWAQLKLHDEPIGIVNAFGYFDGVIQQIDHMIDQGFVKQEYRDLLEIGTDPVDVIQRLIKRFPDHHIDQANVQKL